VIGVVADRSVPALLQRGTAALEAGGIETARPEATPITFILTPTTLVTVRYTTPKSIDIFVARAARQIGFELAETDDLLGDCSVGLRGGLHG